VIVDGLIMLITGIVQWAYDLLPEWNITTQFQNAMRVDGRGYTPLGGYTEGAAETSAFDYLLASMWQMNKFFPVDHLVAALSMVVVFWTAVLAFRGGKWLIGVIRGSGTQ